MAQAPRTPPSLFSSIAPLLLLPRGRLCPSPSNDVSMVLRLDVCNCFCSEAIKFQPSPTQIKSACLRLFLLNKQSLLRKGRDALETWGTCCVCTSYRLRGFTIIIAKLLPAVRVFTPEAWERSGFFFFFPMTMKTHLSSFCSSPGHKKSSSCSMSNIVLIF